MNPHQATAILELTHSAFVSTDESGRIVFWNRRAESMFGYRREDVLGRTVAETIIPERYRAAHKDGLRRFLETGHSEMLDARVELSALRADGSEFPIEMTVSVLPDNEHPSFHAFIADASERHNAAVERQRLLDELQLALHGSEQRLTVTVNALAEAVTIRGTDNRLLYANRAALDRLGLSSLEELRSADPRALMDGYEIADEYGKPVLMTDLPSVRVLRGEDPGPMMLRYVERASGEEHWTLLKAAAIRDAEGSIEAAVTIIEDMTTVKRATLRNEFLARAGKELSGSLDYQRTLRKVATLAVPRVADWCAVDLFDVNGARQSVAVAHVEPEKLKMAEQLRAYEPQELDPEQGLGRVLSTGEPVLYPEITDDLLVAGALDEEHLRLLRAVGIRAILIVPMTVPKRIVGTLTLVSAESGRTFQEDDVQFAQQVADRAALAVENARLYTERAEIASTLQRSLLPDAPPTIPGWEIAAHFQPAGHGEVGGDFYDFWDVEDDWLVMVGDVAGKGAGAAAVTSLVRYTAWAVSEVDRSPAGILARVDRALFRRPSLSVCTALCMRLRGPQATVVSGGHPLPLCIDGEEIFEIGSHGTLLGAFASGARPETEFTLAPNQTLVAYTDGVTEAQNVSGERFGQERLLAVLADARNEPPAKIRSLLIDALNEFQPGPRGDDVAIVVLRYVGEQQAGYTIEANTTGLASRAYWHG